MMTALSEVYPAALMSQLGSHLEGALKALVDAFPNKKTICVDSLQAFADIVDKCVCKCVCMGAIVHMCMCTMYSIVLERD